jgi:hypothetical protein
MYSIYYPKYGSFKIFQKDKEPINLGGTIDLKPLLEYSKTPTIEFEKMHLLPIKQIESKTPEIKSLPRHINSYENN